MKHVHACTDPQHHVDDAAAFVRAVERACSERGLRLTPIRAHVLGLIADAGRPLKAYDLLDQVREGGGPGAAAPPTVYRALDFLLANGFIHKLQSVNAFVACHHPSTAQHSVPFLICDRCHSAVELEDEAVVAALDSRARALGFVPQAQTLERGTIVGQAQLVGGAAGQIGPGLLAHALAGIGFVVGDGGDGRWNLLQLGQGHGVSRRIVIVDS